MQTPVSVSVVFTDLVGSTELSSRLGAVAADEVRRLHFALLREAIDACGGREVKNLGDGLMASFPGVGAALDAAIGMQQAIDRHNRGGGEPLGVRIGVATGDAVEEDGDLFGEPVVQAARLCAAAEGGVILAPDVVRFLAPRGVHELRPVGDLVLKGLPDPVPTVEVCWEPAGVAAGEAVPLQGRLTVAHISGFVGRDAEREILDAARKAAAAGERRAVLVAGEAGMGKTRLVTEVALAAHDQGAVVLYGRCEEELAIPYQPWIEALDHYVAHASEGALGAHDPDRLADLTRLVPELRRRLPGVAAVDTDPATERYLLFGAVAALLADLASSPGGCVLVLDDLHWADRPTVQLLRHVVATPDIGAVLLLCTYRDTDLGADHPMSEALAVLHREPGVDVVRLGGLDDMGVVAFLESIAGHDLPEDGIALAHAVRSETDGNPFFVGEVLRHLAETGAIAQQDGRWVATTDLGAVGLPASVRAVVGQRVRRLGETVHQVLSTAAVAGRDFDLEVVVAASGLDEDDVVDALEAAAAAGLVAEAPGMPDRFTFTHALVQHTLYDEHGGSRRVRLHHRVAEALESILGADPGDRVGELANHWLAATRPADLDKAVDYARRAGDRAMASLAHSEAARWYQLALDAHDQRPTRDDRVRIELLVALGGAREAEEQWWGRDAWIEAARLARAAGEHELLLGALLPFRALARLGQSDAELIALLEDAVTVVSADDPRHGELLATLANELQNADPPRARALADEAIASARRSGGGATLQRAIHLTDFAWLCPDRLGDAPGLAAECLALAEQTGDPVRMADGARLLFLASLGVGDAAGLRAGSQAMAVAASSRLSLPGTRWGMAIVRCTADLLAGDPDAAERSAEEGLALQPDGTGFSVYGAQLFSIRWHQGRAGELIELSEQLAAENPTVGAFRTVVPWLHAHVGDVTRAAETLAEIRRDGFTLAWDPNWLTGTTLLGEAAAIVGDVEDAEARYAELHPWGDRMSFTGATCEGPVAYVLGLLAETLGRPDDAVAHFEAALDMARRLEAPFHLGRVTLALGRIHGDRARIDEVLEVARRHGYAGLERDALGVRSGLPAG